MSLQREGSSAVDTAPRRPGRPRGGSPVTSRAELIEAAVHVLQTVGPDATMDDIAAAVAVTKPVVYRTLGDKAALTEAMSEWLIDRIDRATQIAVAGGVSPRAQFRASTGAYLATIRDHRNVFLFVNAQAPATDLFRRLVDRSAQPLVDLFGSLRARLGSTEAGARTWAYGVIGALQVAATMWQADPYCDLEALADDLTALLWDGLGPSLGG